MALSWMLALSLAGERTNHTELILGRYAAYVKGEDRLNRRGSDRLASFLWFVRGLFSN